MTPSRALYKNPPLQEAVCEIHFPQDEQLDEPKIKLLQPVWKSQYEKQHIIPEKTIEFNIGGAEGVRSNETTVGHRLVCKSVDGKDLAQLSSTLLAVNRISPYYGWDKFRESILERWKELQTTVGVRKFRHVGLRYINRIDIPENPLTWEKWFELRLPIPKISTMEPDSAQMRFQTPIGEGRRLVTNIVTLKNTKDSAKTVVMLDNDMLWDGTPASPEQLSAVVEKLHDNLGIAFEAHLTNTLRALFQQEVR